MHRGLKASSSGCLLWLLNWNGKMWTFFKKVFSNSKSLNSLMGDVIYESHELQGQTSHSLFQWRLKRTVDGQSVLIGLKLLPDGYAGPQGSPTNYISFDLPTAMQIKADLEDCIERARANPGQLLQAPVIQSPQAARSYTSLLIWIVVVIGIILANTLFRRSADTVSSHALSTSSVTSPISPRAQSSSISEAQDSTPVLNAQTKVFLDQLIHAKPSGEPRVGFPGSPNMPSQ